MGGGAAAPKRGGLGEATSCCYLQTSPAGASRALELPTGPSPSPPGVGFSMRAASAW